MLFFLFFFFFILVGGGSKKKTQKFFPLTLSLSTTNVFLHHEP